MPLRLFLMSFVCFATALAAGIPPERVTLRVIALEGLVTDLAVRSPQGITRLVARASAFGPALPALAKEGLVEFFTPAPEGGFSEQPAARFALEQGVLRYLVIVSADGQGNTRRHQVHAIPDPEDGLPAGHARVVNFTGARLAVQLGREAAVIEPARTRVLPCALEDDGHVALRLARPGEETPWRLATSTRVAVPENRRLLLLVVPTRASPPSEGGAAIADGGVFELKIILTAVTAPRLASAPFQIP